MSDTGFNGASALKVDGFVFATTDWRMLPPMGIRIEKKCHAEVADRKTFKGLSVLSQPTAKAIYVLFSKRDSSNYGVLVHPNPENVQNEAVLGIPEILPRFYAALDETCQTMITTRMAKDKVGSQCCKLQTDGGPCNVCKKTDGITVYPEDFERFGRGFHANLDKRLVGYRSLLTVHELGQSTYWDQYFKVLDCFQLQHADEAIIHMAMDFEEDGRFVLWKNLSVPKVRVVDDGEQNQEQDDGNESEHEDDSGNEHEYGGPNEEANQRQIEEDDENDGELEQETSIFKGKKLIFCNLMAQGHCNTEVDLSRNLAYKNKEKTRQVHAAHYKLYSSYLKEIHRYDKQRWKTANVERSLCKVTGFSGVHGGDKFIRPASDILSWIKNLEDLIEQTDIAEKSSARFEAIMRRNIRRSLADDLVCSTSGGLDTRQILEEFKSTFDKEYPQSALKAKLTSIPFPVFANHIADTLTPALQTLKPIVQSFVQKRDRGEILTAIPSYDELQIAVCCEMIISFAVFGKLNCFGRGERFSSQAKTLLNLTPRGQCGYSVNVGANEVFVGLRNVPNVKVVINERDFKILQYTGKESLLSKHMMWSSFKNLWGDDENLKSQINSIYQKRQELQPSYKDEIEDISMIFWDAMKVYAENVVFGGRDATADDLTAAISRINGPVSFVNSMEFINDFFANPEKNEQLGLAYLARELQSGKLVPEGSNFKTHLAYFIDDQIYKSQKLALIYPHVMKSNRNVCSHLAMMQQMEARYSVILPFFGNAEDSFERSSTSAYYKSADLKYKQTCIINLYMQAYRIFVMSDEMKKETVEFVLKHLVGFNGTESRSISNVTQLLNRCTDVYYDGHPYYFANKRPRLEAPGYSKNY